MFCPVHICHTQEAATGVQEECPRAARGHSPRAALGRPSPPWVQRTVFEPDSHTGRSSSRTVAGASKPAFTRTGGSDLIMTAADSFVSIDSSQGHLDVAVNPGDQAFTHP